MSDFTYLHYVTPNADVQKLIGAVVVGGLLVFLGKKAARPLMSQGLSAITSDASALTVKEQQIVIPPRAPSVHALFDFFVEKFVAFQDSVLGKERRRYLPFTGSLFLFVLFGNLIGLIPGFPAVTTSVWVNVGLSLLVFCYFQLEGIRSHGLGGYLAHFFAGCTKGPLLLLGIFLFLLEFFLSLPLRILTLNLRLYWNITADHMVLNVFTELVPYGLPIVFYAFATFVCFMQALVFTTLTMVYILLATQHEEHEDAHH
jgi:F-type H+-transporting ATPase subunit a